MATKTQAPAKPKYMIVQNLTGTTQAIVPDEQARYGNEIIVGPWDSVAIRNWTEWGDDQNLANAKERELVHVNFSDEKPRRMPNLMSDALQNPLERAVCADLVYGSPDRFEFLIRDKLDEKEKRQDFVKYYEERYPVILRAALNWLKAWGPPEALVERMALIEARLTVKK